MRTALTVIAAVWAVALAAVWIWIHAATRDVAYWRANPPKASGFYTNGEHVDEAADRLAELDAEVATLKAIHDGCPRCSQRAALRAEDL